MISAGDARRFDDEGYLVVRGLLDVRRNIRPLRDAYAALIDALATIYEVELGRSLAVLGAPQSEGVRLATLLGLSGGDALHHLAPVLSVFSPRFRWRRDLPPAQLPECFDLMRDAALLDAVEALVGPEIQASPIYHFNLKLAPRHLALAESIAKAAGRRSPSAAATHYGFEVGQTPWHMDAIAGLRDSHQSKIVIAWIPLTPADSDRGALRVVPRSHRCGVRSGPFPDDLLSQAIVVEATPSDVVFMHNTLLHSASENRTADEVRWACNFRYLFIGEANGRPYLPGFIARSRSAPETELTNPHVWIGMWMCALDNLMRGELPVPSVAMTTHARAAAITRQWREAVPDERAWFRLRDQPMRSRALRLARRLAVTSRRWISSIVKG